MIVWLEGKKTYIIALLTIIDGFYQYSVQHGLSRQSLINYLLIGGGLAALRAAIAKNN